MDNLNSATKEELQNKIKEQQTIIELQNNELRKYITLNRELIEKQNKVDETNFFEIQIDEKYLIATHKFTNIVTVLDQTKNFIKYKGSNNIVYYVNKSEILLLKLDDKQYTKVIREDIK